MEMIRNNPYDEWNDKQLAHHFLKTLKILNRKLEDGKIEYFFEPNSNLLENKSMNLESIKSMALWLKNVIQKLENSMGEPYCRKVWMEYFQKPNKGFFSYDVIHSLHSITGIFTQIIEVEIQLFSHSQLYVLYRVQIFCSSDWTIKCLSTKIYVSLLFFFCGRIIEQYSSLVKQKKYLCFLCNRPHITSI